MKIRQLLIPLNEFSRPGIKLKAVKGIVMHYTGSPSAPAINIVNYFGRLSQQNPHDNIADRYASAHYSVDDNEAILAIPENEMAYHVGSTSYTPEALKRLSSYPNNCTIGIEMCIDAKGNITEKTFQNAAELAAMLCKKYGLTENDIWTHKGVVGWKDCPLPWVNKPSEFIRFKQEVAKRLKPQPQPQPAPQPSITYVNINIRGVVQPYRGLLIQDKAFVPIRNVCRYLSVENLIGWDDKTKKASIKGVKLPSTTVIETTGYAWVREIANALGLQVAWDQGTKTVTLN
jgi:hypothetical protein